jgi:phage baseplate assembly protein V
MNQITPRSKSTDKRYYGVYEGIVSDVIDPGQEGRVRIRLPWFDEQMETEWCRARQFYAGNGYGAVFLPEVGDEVLVAFIQGDMRQPIILGGLYNGQDKPPTQRSASSDQKMLRTKAGHVLLLDDSSGQERVKIITKGGSELSLSDVDHAVTLKTSGGGSIKIDDNGGEITIQIPSGQSVKLAPGQITLTAPEIVLSGVQVKLGGDAAAFSAVLGEQLVAMFSAHIHPLPPPFPPTLPPVPSPMLATMLSQITKLI